MFDSIWHDIKRQFNHGNSLTRIIIFNVAFFVFVNLVRFILILVDHEAPPPSYQPFINFFSISSDWQHNLTHPWVFFTHMFLHEGFWHILWNMLMLYWFGRIVGDLLGDRRVLPIYLLGGLAGGLTYFAMANVPTPWGFGGYALGASAAVMCTLLVAGMTAPDYIISLLFLGDVRLKYIVMVLVFLDLVALSWNFNSGGSFGHLGGALMGVVYARQLQNGNDLSVPVSNILRGITNFFSGLFQAQPRRKPKMVFKNAESKRQSRSNRGNRASDAEDLSHQEKVDAILEKIKKSGYDSLSAAEKEFLFNASKK